MKSVICILICLAFIEGCGAPNLKYVDTNLEKTWLSFIEDGKTTKEEITLKYGSPMKAFANDSILIYIMRFDEMKGFIKDKQGILEHEDYHFVFVFDKHNILKKHSFLKTR